MYEETKSSIDWKGLFLKVVIVFLIVLIIVTGYKTLKSNNTKTNNIQQNNSTEVSDSKSSQTFTSNMEKLRTSGKNYFEKNKDKLPNKTGYSTIVTLNDLIQEGYITTLTYEEGKKCDGESSYVTATLKDDETIIKANLVCGTASTYTTDSIAYLDNNTSEEKKSTSTSTNLSNKTNSSSSTSSSTSSSNSSSTSSNKTNSSATSDVCKTNCVPVVNVNTNVSQNVTINGNTTTTTTTTTVPAVKYYTVAFNSNGGNTAYKTQKIAANSKAENPGTNSKYGCAFKGWYYNGSKYDFNTPVTKNITLEAYYTCTNDIVSEDENINETKLVKKHILTYVYTMGWNTSGTENISISHTLKLPKELEKIDFEKVKIIGVNYENAIDTTREALDYDYKHYDTFKYSNNGWEVSDLKKANLAKITGDAVDFDFYSKNRTLSSALRDGFDVTWTTDYVSNQCSETFTVNSLSNLCAYGIVYSVLWEYQIYE